jgi:hypothetical protein
VNDSQGTRSHAEDSTLGFYAPYQDSELYGELSEWHKKQTEGTNVPGSPTHRAHYERDYLRTPDRHPSGIQGSQLEQQKSIAQEHDKQTASNNVKQDKPKTTQEDIKMTDAINPDDTAPAANKPAKPAINMPALIGKSKPRGRSSKIPEHKSKDKKLNKKALKAYMTHIDAKPGDYFYVSLKGYPLWPAIICDESMLPIPLLRSRPVTARDARWYLSR